MPTVWQCGAASRSHFLREIYHPFATLATNHFHNYEFEDVCLGLLDCSPGTGCWVSLTLMRMFFGRQVVKHVWQTPKEFGLNNLCQQHH